MKNNINRAENFLPAPLIKRLNDLAKAYSFQTMSYDTCEICYKTLNLMTCNVCKNYYHAECLNLITKPNIFICPKCQEKIPNSVKILTENSKTNTEIFNSTKMKSNNINKDNNKVESNLNNANTNEINNINTCDDSVLHMQINHTNKESTSPNKNGLMSKKRKREEKTSKKKKVKTAEKEKIEKNKFETNEHINNNLSTANPSAHKGKNNIHSINKLNYNSNTQNSYIDNFLQEQHKARIKELETSIINSFPHANPQYRRRKIKIGSNHNIDMYEFQERYTNQIAFDDDEYERNDLKQVYSCSDNPLSQEQINDYLKQARNFWSYRNMYLEDQLCADFFKECNNLMDKQKIADKLKKKIERLMKELKNLVRRGVDLKCHYDEMALKMLHLCKYKQKVALFFLSKELNPFVEEVEEGFKNDVQFFQGEIVSIITNGDIESDE